MKKVLILCTGNSCRSQMAQAIWQNAGDSEWVAVSAGSRPSGYVHPLALKSIEELGLSIDGLESKSVDLFVGEEIDLAVTVCDHAKEACPVIPGVKQTLHWPFEDPADAIGSDNQKLIQFRKIRDQIKNRIEGFLSGEAGDH
ncbi:MAG: arsenate reductase ArsC [Mariniblastus sp.]|nr:arsenate reductase ArsC [Mariniblastus sp.]MDG1511174.1 arsenate reductase ArsC [Mariniblastus sp.]MDG2180079.1 arsenate reductase ArsC [Mariniblastus sp.]